MASRNLHQAYLLEVGMTQISEDHDYLNICFQQDKFQDRFHNGFQYRFHVWQTPPSSSLKLVEFDTYYIKPNPPLCFCNMVHSHFTLCLRVREYLKRLSQHPWYGLWMRVKGPHHYKVTALARVWSGPKNTPTPLSSWFSMTKVGEPRN